MVFIKKCRWEPHLGKKMNGVEGEAVMQAQLNHCLTSQGALELNGFSNSLQVRLRWLGLYAPELISHGK